MPNVVIIAGPNGAGKSTLAPALLRDTLGVSEYVNADTIAAGLSAFAANEAAFDAGRVMLARLRELGNDGKDFAFETTLASRTYAPWLEKLKKDRDYRVSIIFLWLRDVAIAESRVELRVASGGHAIPRDVIHRRFNRGLTNFFELYLPIADGWRFYDAASNPPSVIAKYEVAGGEKVYDSELWNRLKS